MALIPIAHAVIPAEPTLADVIAKTWNGVIRPAIVFLFLLATVVFIWGLVQFIFAGDNEEGRSTGKKHIVWGLIGMAIMLSTGAIMQVLENFFLDL